MNERFLNIARQRRREAIDVDLVDVQAFWLQIKLMALPLRKAHDLVFKRRAVPRTDALYLPVIEWTLARCFLSPGR